MKRMQVYAALLTLTFCSISANNVTSHSFFSIRPFFESGTPELFTLFDDSMLARGTDGRNGALQVVVFGSTTKECSGCTNPLAEYYLPFGKTTLIAGETGSQAVLNNKADLIANYFGVLTANPTEGIALPDQYNFLNATFESAISFNPRQTAFGVGLHYKQLLSECPQHGVWFSASAPIVHVKNELGYSEQIINVGGGDVQTGFVATVGEALQGAPVFGSKVFKYGKLPPAGCCALKRTGIGDIELKLGYIFSNRRKCYVDGYAGMLLPTGNKPKGEFIFEPIVGNNKHMGFIFGTYWDVLLMRSECKERTLKFSGAVDSRYLIRNIQVRSFDLIDKQWSRYIWLYPDSMSRSITDIAPGINFLTQPVKVHPRFSITTNAELVVTGKYYKGEFGVNMYARQAEHVELACCWQDGPGIVGINANDRFELQTKSNASMNRYVAPSGFINNDTNPSFVPVTKENLNLESAAHPAVITRMVYAALGYHGKHRRHPGFFGIGGSYEFSAENTGLIRGTGWIKGGLSF